MSLRISGLVRFYDGVRAALARGIPLEEREAFRRRVADTLRTVEELCFERGAWPNELPAPSRHAFQFLRRLDLEHLPEPGTGEGPPPAVRVCGALGAGQALSTRIFRDREELLRSEPEREKLRAELTCQADRIERLCGESGSEPSALPTRTRLFYGWLRFLATDGALLPHVRTVAGIAGAAERTGVTGHVHLAAVRTLWRRVRRGPGILFTASEGYLDAPPEVLLALGGLVAGAGAGSTENLAARRYAESAPFAAVVRRIDAAVGGMDHPKGRHHDLAASFLRVNDEYFGGSLARPPLRFGRFPSIRKVAHYEPAGGCIVFSALLDDPAVPEIVIDNIMHHELLHAAIGFGVKNGRRVMHGAGFRELERRFRGYEEAERLLQEFLRRIVARDR